MFGIRFKKQFRYNSDVYKLPPKCLAHVMLYLAKAFIGYYHEANFPKYHSSAPTIELSTFGIVFKLWVPIASMANVGAFNKL